jgi:predicted Zn finger-like uncharacterized protein
MEIQCEHCSAKLNIPEEKIPKGRRIAFNCPKCKNKIKLEPPAAREGTGSTMEVESPKLDHRKRAEAHDEGDEDDDLEFYEEGVKPALIMALDERQEEAIKEATEELGYRYVAAKDTRDAIGRMRYHHFDLVVLSDQFDGAELGQSPIMQYLNNLSTSSRRKMFVALIGDHLKTMDHMTAFTLSANLVISGKDMDKLVSILRHAFTDNEKFYKVFVDVLGELGKS